MEWLAAIAYAVLGAAGALALGIAIGLYIITR